MTKGYLEHANLVVSDPGRSATLFSELCGWRERWSGLSQLGGRTIHVGNDSCYIAFYRGASSPTARFIKGQPLNHIAIVVDELDAAEAVVTQAGLQPFGHDDYDPGHRFYFFDWDGIEYEVVTYG